MTADPVTATIRTLQRSLRGPRRARAEMVREVHDGLADAVEGYRDAGLPLAEAQFRAVADFGDPRHVAAELQAELAARYGRFAAARMAIAFPMLMLLWDQIWAGDPATAHAQATTATTLLADLIDVLSLTAAAGSLLARARLSLGARRGVDPDRVTRGIGFLALCTLVSIGGGSILLNLVNDWPDEGLYDTPLAIGVFLTTVSVAIWVGVSGHRCLLLGRLARIA
ncbi:permease prefix domain 1-containing protein [Saccharomonospora sp. NPDC046836]|uniref:permease prefix domain 1-containing protein n=1 Tax=Saccharomonospora sp. NPDC046836 TaxID=3156921 RepID=UPI0033F5E415